MRRIIVLIAFLTALPAAAEEFTLAVASNFVSTANELVSYFGENTEHEVRLVHGSTGQLFAQIINGAPFEILLAADATRPKLLIGEGKANEVKTYALGRLVLVSSFPVEIETAQDVFSDETVVLADPLVAPYGLAATRAMEGLNLDTAKFSPVVVANVGQVAAIFSTGNASLAFVSKAQVDVLSPAHVLDLDGLYPEIRQDAALLNKANGNPAAEEFWSMLFSNAGRQIIASHQYDLP